MAGAMTSCIVTPMMGNPRCSHGTHTKRNTPKATRTTGVRGEISMSLTTDRVNHVNTARSCRRVIHEHTFCLDASAGQCPLRPKDAFPFDPTTGAAPFDAHSRPVVLYAAIGHPPDRHTLTTGQRIIGAGFLFENEFEVRAIAGGQFTTYLNGSGSVPQDHRARKIYYPEYYCLLTPRTNRT